MEQNLKKANQQKIIDFANSDDYKAAYKHAKSSIKQLDRKIMKSVPKGIRYDWLNNSTYNNVVLPKDKIPDRLLRLVERRNGIVGAIITLRIQQALEFCHISADKDIPGWEIQLRDFKADITPEQEKQKTFLENLIKNTRTEEYQNNYIKHDDFRELITKFVRDRFLIDKIVWEIERNQKGEAIALWVLDGATIQPVLPGGYYGSITSIGYPSAAQPISEVIRRARLEATPPIEEISYVQELIYGSSGGGVVAAFKEDDLIYDLANELNDVRYYKQGLSVTEKANSAIVAFINSLTFNSNGLSRGAIPKVAIAMGKDSGYTDEQLEDMQDEWSANFEAMDGQWNIPILRGDAKILNMLPTNRDMEYQKYMEFTGALTCSIMGVDSAELGLRLNQAQAVLSENQDAKQLFSKNRGVRELLSGFAYIVNNFLAKSGYDFAKDFVFRFNGLSTEDKNFEADLRKKNVETFKTVNEIRTENDLKPIEGGDILLNPVFIQSQQAGQMAGGEEGFGGFSDDDINDIVDDSMQKAVRLI
jgi:hypothetical protein